MKLQFACSSCGKNNLYTPKAPTRGDLHIKIGITEVQVNCQICGNRERKHLNTINAIVDYKIIGIGFVLGIIATLGLWNFYGAVSTASFFIPMLFWIQENNAVSGFNKYHIKRK